MWILDRYIVKEMLPPFVLGLGTFFVVLVGDIFYTLAEPLVTGRIAIGTVVRLLAYKMPAIMAVTLPVATLVGTLLGLGRLVRDRELRAMRLMGAGLFRLFAPALAFGLVVGAVTFFTNEVLSPVANRRANTLIRRTLFARGLPAAREGVFWRGPAGQLLYAGRVDARSGRLKNVVVYESAGPFPRLITASDASWASRIWTLRDGVAHELDARGFTSYEVEFEIMEIDVGVDEGAMLADGRTPEEMTVGELRRQAAVFRTDMSPQVATEYYRRFAVPAASFIFALLAAPLSLLTSQGGRLVGVGGSVFLLFVYYVVMSVARALGTTGLLPPLLSAWAPNLLFLTSGIVLVVKVGGHARSPRFVAVVRGYAP